jgi:hypothetical protein
MRRMPRSRHGVGGLLPREVLLTAFKVNIDTDFDPSAIAEAKGFLAAYRMARDYVGAEPNLIEAEPR